MNAEPKAIIKLPSKYEPPRQKPEEEKELMEELVEWNLGSGEKVAAKKFNESTGNYRRNENLKIAERLDCQMSFLCCS